MASAAAEASGQTVSCVAEELSNLGSVVSDVSNRKISMECEAITDLTVDDSILGVGQGRTIASLDGRDCSISVEVRHIVELNKVI